MCSGDVVLPCKAHLDAFFLPLLPFGKKQAVKVGTWFTAGVFPLYGCRVLLISSASPSAEQLLPNGPFPRRGFSENTSATSLYCSQSSVLSSSLLLRGVPPLCSCAINGDSSAPGPVQVWSMLPTNTNSSRPVKCGHVTSVLEILSGSCHIQDAVSIATTLPT